MPSRATSHLPRHRAARPDRTGVRTAHRRTVRVLTAALAAVAALLGLALSSGAASAATAPVAVGIIGPTSDQLQALQGSDVTRVVVQSGWGVVEPGKNTWNTDALSYLASEVTSLQAQGYEVVLDLGLQYPPSWAFSLAGPTRFVDQYGDTWQGSLSEDVPNAVFNQNVRNAETTYIQKVAAAIGPANVSSVRVGGLLSGELRYPPNTYNGHQDLIWDYDAKAQASAPVKNWKPGTGTAKQARSSLNYYFDSLTSYESWMMQTVGSAFPSVDQQVMLPGWGLRPGMVDDAINSGMQNQSIAEVNGLISSGLDWAGQVQAIANSGQNATVYTTWLDAPQQNSTVQGIAPIDYLASLAQQYGLPLAGENTGGGGSDALALMQQRAETDGLTSVTYMSGSAIDDGSAGITLDQLSGMATQLAS